MRAIARTTYLRAWTVIAGVLVVLAAAAFIAFDIFDRVDPFDISDPGSDVERASAQVEELTGQSAEPGVVLLVDSAGDVPSVESTLAGVGGIASVVGPESVPQLTDPDGRSLVLGYLDPGAVRVDVGEDADNAFADNPDVATGGTAVASHQVGVRSEDDSRKIELLASPILLLLLLIVFRTPIAAVLPLMVAGVTIAITFATLRLLTGVTQIDLFSLQVVTGLGVGLAIDYSLFVIARYREEISTGKAPDYMKAQVRTLRTAGRTVAFSALTVAAALAALTVFPQPFLRSTGIAGGLTALFAGLTSLIALPAVLALIGPSINRFGVRRDPMRPGPEAKRGGWRRACTAVCRFPISSIIVGAAVMLALGSQALGVSLTTPDARELPSEDSARVVAEAAIESFPEVPATEIYALVDPADAEISQLRPELKGLTNVEKVLPPVTLSDGTVQLRVLSDVDPLSDAGQDLVSVVRSTVPDGSLVGGRAAELADQRTSVEDHTPEAILILVLTNLLLVALMTRSLILPFLALTMNVLTVAASLGAMTAIFTNDWSADLLATDAQSGIDISVPVLAFAVAFGLSTDYGIFLLSRIREARRSASSESEAIIEGVASSGRLISASAVLLAVAVGAFAFSDLVIIKEFAVAIAIAVLLDATVVRGLLIPALLRLLGRAAWWPKDGELDGGGGELGRKARKVKEPKAAEMAEKAAQSKAPQKTKVPKKSKDPKKPKKSAKGLGAASAEVPETA